MIKPCLWFDGNAQEAVEWYVETVPNSRVTATTPYPEGAPLPAGTVMTIDFVLAGRAFMALNGGPQYAFTPAVSMMITCDTQQEIDRLWDAFTSGGGKPLACGWVNDRWGLSWQVVPSILFELMAEEPAVRERVLHALWGMMKLEIEGLKQAAGR